MKQKKDLKFRLKELSKKYNRYVWRAIFVRLFVLFIVFNSFLWSLGTVLTGQRHWLWLFVTLLAVLMFIAALVVLVLLEIKLQDYTAQFLKMINGRCAKPYTVKDLISLKVVGHYFKYPTNFYIWGEYLITMSNPRKDTRPAERIREAEAAWHKKTDGLLQESLESLPNNLSGYRLQLRIRRALGNRSMHWRDKHILLLTIYAYFWPNAEDIAEVKSKLGGWFSHVPRSLQRSDFAGEVLAATRSTTYEPKLASEPVIPKVKPLPKLSPVIEPKILPGDVQIDLKYERHKMLSLETIEELVPKTINSKLVWAIFLTLLEPGKKISMAGGWMRKEVKICQQVERLFKQEGWEYPGNKPCEKTLDWLTSMRALNKRSHGRDFGLDFHTSGKSEVGNELSRLLVQAQSMRIQN